jgi:tetratricopeptide (TPR) repeat protein
MKSKQHVKGRSKATEASPKKLKPMMSTVNFFDAKNAKNNKNPPSAALLQALTQVKDFMTDSQKALILLREGKALFDAGDARGALDCFSEGISYNPTVTLFNQRATSHKALEMYTEAYFDYSYNIRLEPEVGAHYCSRGLCLARLKKMSLALEDMDVAILHDPSATHYYSRATVYGDFGNFEEALIGKHQFLLFKKF